MHENSWKHFFKYIGILVGFLLLLVIATAALPASVRGAMATLDAVYILLLPPVAIVLLVMKVTGKGMFNGSLPNGNKASRKRTIRIDGSPNGAESPTNCKEQKNEGKPDKVECKKEAERNREAKKLASKRVKAAKASLKQAKRDVTMALQQRDRRIDEANKTLSEAEQWAQSVMQAATQPLASYCGVDLYGDHLSYNEDRFDLKDSLKCHIETSGNVQYETVYDQRARSTVTRVVTGAVIGGIPGAVVGGAARKKDLKHHSETYDTRNVYLYIECDGRQWLIIDSQDDDSQARIFMNYIVNAINGVDDYKRKVASDYQETQEVLRRANANVEFAKQDRADYDAAVAVRDKAEKEYQDAVYYYGLL